MYLSAIAVVLTLCLTSAAFGVTCPTIVTQADVDLSQVFISVLCYDATLKILLLVYGTMVRSLSH
jgi:hypothetical protein